LDESREMAHQKAPLWERYETMMEAKRQRLKQMEMTKERDDMEEMPFQPTITQYAKNLVGAQEPWCDRYEAWIERRDRVREEGRQRQDEDALQECTFQPHVPRARSKSPAVNTVYMRLHEDARRRQGDHPGCRSVTPSRQKGLPPSEVEAAATPQRQPNGARRQGSATGAGSRSGTPLRRSKDASPQQAMTPRGGSAGERRPSITRSREGAPSVHFIEEDAGSDHASWDIAAAAGSDTSARRTASSGESFSFPPPPPSLWCVSDAMMADVSAAEVPSETGLNPFPSIEDYLPPSRRAESVVSMATNEVSDLWKGRTPSRGRRSSASPSPSFSGQRASEVRRTSLMGGLNVIEHDSKFKDIFELVAARVH